ncbi:MAG TPA: hypothetical protein DCM87_13580 [Planctomycetes bacterium]|nr:hypothetical protein [Planctomycetota bacterium]
MRKKTIPLAGTLAFVLTALPAGAQENDRKPLDQPAGREEVAGTRESAPPLWRSPYADIMREAVAVRVEEGPRVDGRLDDAAWKAVPPGGPLVQVVPYEGAEPTQRTEFRVVYDADAIYFGVWCHDDRPDLIVANEMLHDGRLYADDEVIIVIDTFLDRRNGYQFIINPNGARGEALISDNVSLNDDWDGVWTAAATIDAEGWNAEAAIPFKSLSFDPGTEVWGFNIFRQIRRNSEKNRWVSPRPELSTHNVAEAGTLRGLSGLRHGIGLEVIPYALGKYRRDHDSGDEDWKGEWGGDLRYRITPNLTASLSYNTDFAETEVDMRQINLTRFPLFFPEKRGFFLEDSGVFRFGGLGTNLMPFFSRRIGLSEEGEPVPILLAGKVTGRVGPYNIGAIDAVLDEHGDLDTENAFVARVSRNVLEQSSLGAIVTAGDPNSERENVLGGADFGYRTTSLFGDHVLQGNMFFMGTYTEETAGAAEAPDGTGLSFGGNLSLPNDVYSASIGFYQVDEEFEPALGFAPRRGVRAYTGSASFKPRPESWNAVRQLFFTYSNSHFTDLANELETASHTLTPLSFLFESGDSVYASVSGTLDAPGEDFEIHPGVVIPAGEYWWPSGRVGLDSSNARPIEIECEGSTGGFYDGRKTACWGAVEVRPIKYFGVRMGYSVNAIRLPEGDFDTQLASVRARFTFTPNLAWHNLVQYDSVSETAGYNSRLVWEFRPGAKAYLVLNQIIDRADHRLTWLESEAVLKVGMAFRF